MKVYIFMFFILPSVTLASLEKNLVQKNLFGMPLRIFHKDSSLNIKFTNLLKSYKATLNNTYDPDCLYKNKGNKTCGQKTNKKELLKIETFSQELRRETIGHFDYDLRIKRKKYRDFGGIAQGYILDKLVKEQKTGWLGDFAGDIFISPDLDNYQKIYLSHPLIENRPYAKLINSGGGWVMNSSSRLFKSIKPSKFDRKEAGDFSKIIIFASPKMKGARIDAWTTALISGGKKLLNQLWKLKKYQKKWAYIYFDTNGEAFCSKNIICKLDTLSERKVFVNW